MTTNSGSKDSFFKTKQPKNDGFFVTKNLKITPSSSTTKNLENSKIKSSKFRKTTPNTLSIDRQEKSDKRQFDKKKWRLQKYSNKYKLQQWEDKRKQKILREYYKDLKDTGNKFDVAKIYAEADEDNDNNFNTNLIQDNRTIDDNNAENEKRSKQNMKNKAFRRAQLEFERIKEEKKRKKEEYERVKAEKEEALKQYKKNKLEKFKKLSRKTKKGQPVMKDRMELLLEKIQQSIQS